MPSNPFEAELLSMAAAVAGDNKGSSSESEDEDTTETGNLKLSLLKNFGVLKL